MTLVAARLCFVVCMCDECVNDPPAPLVKCDSFILAVGVLILIYYF